MVEMASSEVSSLQTSKTQRRRELVRASIRDALAGAAAGAFAKSAVAPIERVKLLLQLQGSLEAGAVGTGAWNVAKSVYREEGIIAFWRGNTPNVIRQGGAAALNFMLMDWYKLAIAPVMTWSLTFPSNRTEEARKRRRALISSFLSGGLAGGTTTTVLYPVEFMRTRLAMDVGATRGERLYPRGMRDVFCSTLKADGIRGLYQGFGIAVAGVIIYRALHLGGYDAMKSEILHYRQHSRLENSSLSITERFAAAQAVSIVAGTMCYPIDSVRRRLMMQAGLPVQKRLYRNSLHCFKRVYVDEGVKGFFLGLGPNLLRSFGGALLLVGYDTFKGMIM